MHACKIPLYSKHYYRSLFDETVDDDPTMRSYYYIAIQSHSSEKRI